ncbi:unnamed protein product [Rhizophagus irregularis]|nr:unnamed protein product [Rhizophagus irregularis]
MASWRINNTDFNSTYPEFFGSNFVLYTNLTVPKMPVKTKTRHNLNLCGYNFLANLSICRPADPNFKFKKRNPSHIFSEMACNGLHYGILSNYSDTYILSQARRNNSYVSRGMLFDLMIPIQLYANAFIISANSSLMIIIYGDSNDSNDPDYSGSSDDDSSDDYGYDDSSGKRKRTPKTSSKKTIAIVAWKTCDTYKKQGMKTLKQEAHIYSVLKELKNVAKTFLLIIYQVSRSIPAKFLVNIIASHAIPRLFYNGYVYDGNFFALALQLIERRSSN